MDSTINGGSGKESDDPTVNPNAYSITSPDSSEKLEKKAKEKTGSKKQKKG